MRILGSVIQALVLSVLDGGHHLAFSRAIAGQLIGNHDARRPTLPLQQLPEQAFGGPFVPSALHENVEHEAVLVHCAPQPQDVIFRSELHDLVADKKLRLTEVHTDTDGMLDIARLDELVPDWTERDLWRRIHDRDLPYHPLHDQGYASIGCAPCTQPGSGREGRWAGTDKVECGLHVA